MPLQLVHKKSIYFSILYEEEMKQYMHKHQLKCNFGSPPPIKFTKRKLMQLMSYHLDHNNEKQSGKNIHTIQPPRCNSQSVKQEISDICNISHNYKSVKIGGKIAAKPTLLAITLKLNFT